MADRADPILTKRLREKGPPFSFFSWSYHVLMFFKQMFTLFCAFTESTHPVSSLPEQCLPSPVTGKACSCWWLRSTCWHTICFCARFAKLDSFLIFDALKNSLLWNKEIKKKTAMIRSTQKGCWLRWGCLGVWRVCLTEQQQRATPRQPIGIKGWDRWRQLACAREIECG